MMVIYDLICPQGHQFEGWFPGYEAFEKQLQQGLVACHVCGDSNITKVISGGHIMGSRKADDGRTGVRQEPPPQETPQDSPPMAASGKIDGITFLKAMRHYVTQNFENVGDRFPRLIREMHAGKIEERNIYGRVSGEEQQKLAEEEIPHMLLPNLPPEFDN